MQLRFMHIRGYSAVDHFGPEIVSLCKEIAAARPLPDGLVYRDDHILSDYRKMFAHGRSIVREALSRFRPCADYSGPMITTVRIDVAVASREHGDGVPPLVGEHDLSMLAEYRKEFRKVPVADKAEWRNKWVRSHPECAAAV